MLGLSARRQWQRSGAVLATFVFLILVFAQIALGGFVAGLDAGHAAADWPAMNGQMIPDGLWSQNPAWRNLFENATSVHFFHRLLAYGIFIYGLFMARIHRRGSGWLIVVGLCVQVTLGIATVVGQVPLSTALMHQGGALLVVALALWHLHGLLLTRAPVPDRR
jgi:heme a synthase